jgi:alpha-galactosidase
MHRLQNICFFIIQLLLVLSITVQATAQTVKESPDSLVLANDAVSITLNNRTGTVSYRFANGSTLNNTTAYVQEILAGQLSTTDFKLHVYTIDEIEDTLGKGSCLNIIHEDGEHAIRLVQHITLYRHHPFVLISAEAEFKKNEGRLLETRHISPLTMVPAQQGHCFVPGKEPRILDVPFDNDDWVNVIEQRWPQQPGKTVSGTSYEMAAVYDNATMNGFVAGSVTHDFWKTGIRYTTGATNGRVDSLIVYGGAATPDNPALPASHGGRDGTHDHIPHGTMRGATVRSPLIYCSGTTDVRKAFTGYGQLHTLLYGKRSWKGYAPVYWNSFGVEGVLGYTKLMMPAGVVKTSDFIASLNHFNSYAQPVLSIDSYDGGIYTTDMLSSIGKYAKKKNQQMGFYFIPFAIWTWKNAVDQTQLQGTPYYLRDVVLRDGNNKPIAYKNGDWGAYPIDPTHPATRQFIISQLQKARAIHATFIKIDFLSAGSLESSVRYDPAVRTGMQAYSKGMRMLKHLVDSIMGPDIFITQAISPMFPHQYAHTRFVSTDVYSHLRDDQPGFPNWGSTQASLANGSHYWWVHGTLWPYTNLDVCIMKNFQKNPDLTEQEIKVRLYSMMVMGSILGDGSDFRHPVAAGRAKRFLNHKALCAYFSDPKAFTPLQWADGESFNQQLSFYLPGDTTLLGLFNFDTAKTYIPAINSRDIALANKQYIIKDFLTGAVVGQIEKGQNSFSLSVPVKDALVVKLEPIN